MGRKKKFSGGYIVANAETLFEQSIAAGKPDYSYIAIAIGSAPASPPYWAMFECIRLRQAVERGHARGTSDDVSHILDEVVRYFDMRQRQFEMSGAKTPKDRVDWKSYSAPSLRSAVLQVMMDRGLRQNRHSEVADDWWRDVRDAWDWEQKHDQPPPSLPPSLWYLEGFEATTRIQRVLMEAAAEEFDGPKDLNVAAWILKQVANKLP